MGMSEMIHGYSYTETKNIKKFYCEQCGEEQSKVIFENYLKGVFCSLDCLHTFIIGEHEL